MIRYLALILLLISFTSTAAAAPPVFGGFGPVVGSSQHSWFNGERPAAKAPVSVAPEPITTDGEWERLISVARERLKLLGLLSKPRAPAKRIKYTAFHLDCFEGGKRDEEYTIHVRHPKGKRPRYLIVENVDELILYLGNAVGKSQRFPLNNRGKN